MFQSCVLLLSAAICANAAVARFPYEEKPAELADREGCYLSSLNMILPYNEPYYPDKDQSCVQYKCSRDSNTVSLFSCGAVAIKPGCRPVSDSTKRYPDCCPTEKCD